MTEAMSCGCRTRRDAHIRDMFRVARRRRAPAHARATSAMPAVKSRCYLCSTQVHAKTLCFQWFSLKTQFSLWGPNYSKESEKKTGHGMAIKKLGDPAGREAQKHGTREKTNGMAIKETGRGPAQVWRARFVIYRDSCVFRLGKANTNWEYCRAWSVDAVDAVEWIKKLRERL